MCSPPAMMAITAASTAFSMIGQRQQGRYQSKVNRNNSIIQNQMAKDAIHRGDIAESTHRMKVAQMKSSQKAKMAASGLDVNSGSPGDILADTVMMGELDALTLRNNAYREAFGHQVSAVNYSAQSKADKATGNNNAMGTLLTGSGSVANQWYQNKALNP